MIFEYVFLVGDRYGWESYGFMHMGEVLDEVQTAVEEMASFAHQNLNQK